MTIVASVKVRDGLVLGTDSMTQIIGPSPAGQPMFLKSYSNARKLFCLGSAPVGVMTYGLGNIGEQSIEGLVLEFCGSTLDPSGSVGDIAASLFAFVEPKWRQVVGPSPDPTSSLGFCIAGYSPGQAFAELHEFLLPRDTAPTIASDVGEFGLLWRGVDSPLIRLIKGWDPQIANELLAGGMDAPDVESLLTPREWFLSMPGMPLQDAVNLVDFLLTTTARLCTFVEPNPTCGGPLQVATILPEKGFSWINHAQVKLPHSQESQ